MNKTSRKEVFSKQAAGIPVPGPANALPRIASQALFRNGREVLIEHGGREYHLRITAAGKLILTA